MTDHVARVVRQWKSEYPEVDASPMYVLARMMRLNMQINKDLSANFAKFGLATGDFDVLATLRRSGEPYALRPTELTKSSMLTSGTMTSRLDKLEKLGLVRRNPNPEDRRALMIHLTDKGRSLVEEAAAAHFEMEAEMLKILDPEDRDALEGILERWSHRLEENGTM
ncbi:HTH-type transcriptional regulator MhqR [Pseudovibrio sp. Ad46]|uniref:MarR family winged helix-turn-helix transcriptional regulator n=1 Tax=unclassified Pseudovibrio TaxID=2627060 RepID=UPI0007AEB0DD|nr:MULTISPECIES: MarR family transcriptional regulator [unclassified Pseudovibrio]KZK86457.1 HTH-type transcriptional regulator MhqR [Pseudovibrio sp. Ad46]KZK92066.1 HTH-type transcriptional regulator MhqR [Pseudovibrio sp. Ad5]